MLGCGSNTAVLTARGGGTVIAEYEYETLSYGRVLNDSSSAQVRIPACDAPIPIAWEHELACYRDRELVWVGPVTELQADEQGLTVQSRDLWAWLERRLPPSDRTFKNTDLSSIFRTLVEDAMSRDPSPGLVVSVSMSGVVGDRTVLQSAYRRVADEFRELATTAVDWTILARILYASKPPRTFVLQDEHINEPKLQVRGLDVASEVTVLGVPGIQSTATTPFFRTGLLETVASEPSILDHVSAAANARARLDFLRDELLVLDCSLTQDAPVTFADLVPGALVAVSVRLGAFEIAETMRLLAVKVEDGPDGERVSVTLTSVGER